VKLFLQNFPDVVMLAGTLYFFTFSFLARGGHSIHLDDVELLIGSNPFSLSLYIFLRRDWLG